MAHGVSHKYRASVRDTDFYMYCGRYSEPPVGDLYFLRNSDLGSWLRAACFPKTSRFLCAAVAHLTKRQQRATMTGLIQEYVITFEEFRAGQIETAHEPPSSTGSEARRAQLADRLRAKECLASPRGQAPALHGREA